MNELLDPGSIMADELAKMSDSEFLAYILNWSRTAQYDFMRLLVIQNARRLDWIDYAQRRIAEAQKQIALPLSIGQ